MPSNHLILCYSLLLPPSIFPSIRVFSNESVLHIRWPKYWSFSFSISPSSEYSRLISFRMDWLDLLAVQGTLKSLLQHHSSKADKKAIKRTKTRNPKAQQYRAFGPIFLDAQCRRHKWRGFDPWVEKIPWRRAWQPTLVLLPGKSHGQRSLWATVHKAPKSWTQLKWLYTLVWPKYNYISNEILAIPLKEICSQNITLQDKHTSQYAYCSTVHNSEKLKTKYLLKQ